MDVFAALRMSAFMLVKIVYLLLTLYKCTWCIHITPPVYISLSKHTFVCTSAPVYIYECTIIACVPK